MSRITLPIRRNVWLTVEMKALENRADSKAPEYNPVTMEEKKARQPQREWAKKLNRDVDTKSPTGVVMVVIPPVGETLVQPYLMGKYEVTQGEWEAVMSYNPSVFQKRYKAVEGLDTSTLSPNCDGTGRRDLARLPWFSILSSDTEVCHARVGSEGAYHGRTARLRVSAIRDSSCPALFEEFPKQQNLA